MKAVIAENLTVSVPNQYWVHYTERNTTPALLYCLETLSPYNLTINCPLGGSYELSCTGFSSADLSIPFRRKFHILIGLLTFTFRTFIYS